MTRRQLKHREVIVKFDLNSKVHLTEVNSISIDYNQLLGQTEGLTRNFQWAWRTGIVSIDIQGHSFIGAFMPELPLDRVDKDISIIRAKLTEFQDYTKIGNENSHLWILDDSGDSEFYEGRVSSFKFTETSTEPYYLSYSLSFRSVSHDNSLKKIEDLAKLDKSDFYLSRYQEIRSKQSNETKLSQSEYDDESVIVSPKELGGVEEIEIPKTVKKSKMLLMEK